MIKIYSAGKELKDYYITQDENGASHKGLTYSSGVLQNALDFGGQKSGNAITINEDVKIYSQGTSAGNWIVVQSTSDPTIKIMFVHVYKKYGTNGKTVPKGSIICQVAPTSQNGGYAIHLHISARKNDKAYKIRDIIYAKADPLETCKAKLAAAEEQLTRRESEIVTYKTRIDKYVKQIDTYKAQLADYTAIKEERDELLKYKGDFDTILAETNEKHTEKLAEIAKKDREALDDKIKEYELKIHDIVESYENQLKEKGSIADDKAAELGETKTKLAELKIEYNKLLKEKVVEVEKPLTGYKTTELLNAVVRKLGIGDFLSKIFSKKD